MDKQQLNEELKAWKARLDRGEITEAAYDKAIEPILEALNEPYAQAAKKAADAPTEMGLLPEQVVGDAHHQFKLEERLGEGGMGQVWKAEDLDCKQDWSNHDCYRALKFPPTVWLSDETAKKNLKREANAAKLLDCPHTVKVYGWHEQQRGNNLPSQVFIEMEYLEGKSFAQHLKDDWKDGLPFQRVMELIEPVAQSLDCAHQKNINHRDIKPANLFLIEAGEVKVLDFGIADEYRKTDASLGTKLKEQKYRSSGTPGYMAPEVSTSKPEPRQDIHALACVIYELLTGEPAFTITPDTPRHPHFYPEPPKSLTQAAWEVLKNGFAFEAEKRPASAGELVMALREAQTAPRPKPESQPQRQQKAEEQKKPRTQTISPPFAWGKALAVLFVVLLLGTGGYGWQQGWFKEKNPEPAQVSSNQAEQISPRHEPAKAAKPQLPPMESIEGWSANKLAARRQQTAQALGIPEAYRETLPGGVELSLRLLPGGQYRMGSPDGEGYSDEHPRHWVSIQPFYMGETEVTVAQYAAFLNDQKPSEAQRQKWVDTRAEDSSSNHLIYKNGRYQAEAGHANYPVNNVSWHGAKAFVDWLSRRSGKRYRLPSEAEWEYAARAGSSGKYSWGDAEPVCQKGAYNGAKFDDNKGCDDTGTEAVRFSAANGFGLYDLHGNLWEWVEDCLHSDYKSAPTDGSVWSGGDCGRRVLRGGSWAFYPVDLRAAGRDGYGPGSRDDVVGFRVARSAPL